MRVVVALGYDMGCCGLRLRCACRREVIQCKNGVVVALYV